MFREIIDEKDDEKEKLVRSIMDLRLVYSQLEIHDEKENSTLKKGQEEERQIIEAKMNTITELRSQIEQ